MSSAGKFNSWSQPELEPAGSKAGSAPSPYPLDIFFTSKEYNEYFDLQLQLWGMWTKGVDDAASPVPEGVDDAASPVPEGVHDAASPVPEGVHDAADAASTVSEGVDAVDAASTVSEGVDAVDAASSPPGQETVEPGSVDHPPGRETIEPGSPEKPPAPGSP
uniref:Uncharacterized protein n=1 Tax=Amphiprion ocellaris TaxID=80972 RepID=A0AAQ5ZG74_AMPOC